MSTLKFEITPFFNLWDCASIEEYLVFMQLDYRPHHASPTLGVVHFVQILSSFRQIILLCLTYAVYPVCKG